MTVTRERNKKPLEDGGGGHARGEKEKKNS